MHTLFGICLPFYQLFYFIGNAGSLSESVSLLHFPYFFFFLSFLIDDTNYLRKEKYESELLDDKEKLI